MKNVFLIFVLFFLFNCNKEKAKESNPKISILKKTEEDFNKFFDKFQKDSVYQKQRVNFPLKCKVFDIDNFITEKKLLKENEYHYFYIDENEVSIEKKISNDSAKVILKGKEDGVLIELKFLRINAIWKLELFDDQST